MACITDAAGHNGFELQQLAHMLDQSRSDCRNREQRTPGTCAC